MQLADLRRYGASDVIIQSLRDTGIKDIYPPQLEALRLGLLSTNDSFVVASPTASGKTLVAEMAILKTVFEEAGKAIYLVPLRALAGEKYADFSRKYKPLGIGVGVATGDYDSKDPYLAAYDVIISTNEKMDSLLRHGSPWIHDVALVVADEIHLITDAHRGPTLEVVLARLRQTNPNLRVIALSATIRNAHEIARWLNARVLESTWRPVPLKEGIYFDKSILFDDGSHKEVKIATIYDPINIALSVLDEGGQALIFVNTRKSTESVAAQAAKEVGKRISDSERKLLEQASEGVLKALAEPTRICRRLGELVKYGVAFHHAGIYSRQRKIVEDSFRENRIKLVVATTTLAMGLNFPSRRVIIRDWWRYQAGYGMGPIPVMEIKQMGGRAGRPGYDDYGEAVLIAKSRRDQAFLFERYVGGEPERVISKLGTESALRSHILACIATFLAKSEGEILDFISHTFFAIHKDPADIISIIREILTFLIEEDMIKEREGDLKATPFGTRVAQLYIDPLSAVIIRDALLNAEERDKDLTPFSFLHTISATPDMMVLRLRKRDYEKFTSYMVARKDEFLLPLPKEDYEEFLAQVKTALVFLEWIEETPEDKIVGSYHIGPGDMRALVELGKWLLFSSYEIGRVFKLRRAVKYLSPVRKRLAYGVKKELLELVALQGIGRVRGRNLFNAGYKTIRDLKKADVEDLTKVPTIGKEVAKDIRRQVT